MKQGLCKLGGYETRIVYLEVIKQLKQAWYKLGSYENKDGVNFELQTESHDSHTVRTCQMVFLLAGWLTDYSIASSQNRLQAEDVE